jgi:RimJ/RimL family protein N-acetyltransferase
MKAETRVFLSTPTDGHISRFMELSDDAELVATMGWKPFGPGESDRFARFMRVLSLPDLIHGKDDVFSIISAADDRAIGYVSIKGVSETQSRAEVGIAVMDKEYRGKGYGTEALRQAIDYAFNQLGLAQLGLTVFPSNRRAIRVYEKLGFRKTSTLKDSWLLPDGQYTDMWLMELSPDRFLARLA